MHFFFFHIFYEILLNDEKQLVPLDLDITTKYTDRQGIDKTKIFIDQLVQYRFDNNKGP